MAIRKFPYKTTKHVRELIAKTESKAVARQFDFNERECETSARSDFVTDPVNDTSHYIGNGIIKKYKNRVLVIATVDCSVHCRYCFRRNFDYQQSLNIKDIDSFVEQIRALNEVEEVILSGGDPLVLSNASVCSIFDGLERCRNISRIRIHSRMLTVLPSRFGESLLSIFKSSSKKVILVSHINHSDEISEKSIVIADKLRKANVVLLNQSVLLRGVNDSSKVLADLSNNLFQAGILPYYINLLDKVIGSEHYYVESQDAISIYQELSEITSGYLLPKLVYDDGGKSSKRLIGTD